MEYKINEDDLIPYYMHSNAPRSESTGQITILVQGVATIMGDRARIELTSIIIKGDLLHDEAFKTFPYVSQPAHCPLNRRQFTAIF